MARWHVACDHCDAEAWVGHRGRAFDAWCEACQRSSEFPHEALRAEPCPHCGVALDGGTLRFEELYGELQHLAAVLDAWGGDPAALGAILPERPRFLTDLNPPERRPSDPPEVRQALAALVEGRFSGAHAALAREAPRATGELRARILRAMAIACERLGEPAGAERAWDAALEAGEHPVARLARGALRARRGDYDGARQDFDRAGDGREARWNRAAVKVLEAVSATPGLPAMAVIDGARAEAGAASAYWSDHTVGRLLWTALVERAAGRGTDGAASCGDARVLRAAEQALEFDTFWDRALMLHGYARLGMRAEAAEAAQTLARDLALGLRDQPCLKGAAAAPIADAVHVVIEAIGRGDAPRARAHAGSLLAREDLQRYRIPCARCGQGTVGVDRVDEDGDSA